MDYRLDRFNLDHGLDSISKTHAPDASLPDASQLPPAEQARRAELDKVLLRPNLSEYLSEQLRPPIEDPLLLKPHHFQNALHCAVRTLHDKALKANKGSDTASLIERAARVLGEEVNLRDLLGMYRNTLFQG